jgi:small-conductance mechanosensitive channel/CRP-like cAMP-binding protein
VSTEAFSGSLADPMVQIGLLVIISSFVTRVALRRRPRWRLISQLAFFVALTLLLFEHGIEPNEVSSTGGSISQRILTGLAKIVWWENAAWSLTNLVRVFLVIGTKPHQARLAQDLVVGVIYVGATLSIFAFVFNAPVGTLIATSGIFAIILGLAMQNTLGDVFAGIALNLGKPYGIGDRIALSDGIEGVVVETNWRATHLLNGANDLVIVPNGDLAKARPTNLSTPQRNHGVKLSVRLQPTMTPSDMLDVMRTVLLNSASILSFPEPSVGVKALDADAVELELNFMVADASASRKAQNEIFDLIYRHAKAAGLKLSPPRGASPLMSPAVVDSQRHATPLRLLEAVSLFATLTEDEKETLAGTMIRRTYQKGEVLARQGTVLCSLMIIRSGAVTVVRRALGRDLELCRLAPGDCFGEGGMMMGDGEPGTVHALTFVVVYEIAKEGLVPLMRDRPAIAEELGQVLSKRKAVENLIERDGDRRDSGTAPGFVERIRRLFDVPLHDEHKKPGL